MVSQTIATAMQVEQAIFASADRGNVKGYQLVAKSPGVDSEMAIELTRAAPTQLPSGASERGTISSWILIDGAVVVARTVHGGPEYSNRGGTQVVTLFLILRKLQFQAYDYDAIAVVRTALALGHLRLPVDSRQERLPIIELPTQPLFRTLQSRPVRSHRPSYDALIEEAAGFIKASQRVAVIGLADPIEAVELLISKLTMDQRRQFSFTTGLSPSIRRPVKAHFYRYPDTARRRTLETEGVACLSAVIGS